MLPIHFGRETVPSGASAGTERNDSGPVKIVSPVKQSSEQAQEVPGPMSAPPLTKNGRERNKRDLHLLKKQGMTVNQAPLGLAHIGHQP